MSESSLPPSPPTKSSTGAVVAGAIVLALLAGGGLYFALSGEKGSDNSPLPVKTAAPAPSVAPAPPPPPPPPPPPDEVTTAATTAAPTRSGPAVTGHEPTGPSGCGGSCTGSADASLRDALRLRGASAKGCYNKALRSNPTLKGKMTVAVRLSPTGGACSASVASDSLGDPSVSSCILQKFRAGAYPKPKGGCVDVQVPLNFVPGGD